MWAEAWIGPDQWVPMDAALDGFDVGHIAITKSALEEVNPIVDLNTPVFQLMESLKIEIVKTVAKRDMPLPASPLPVAETSPAPSSVSSTRVAPQTSPAPTPSSLPPLD
jgi:hypothetical protein